MQFYFMIGFILSFYRMPFLLLTIFIPLPLLRQYIHLKIFNSCTWLYLRFVLLFLCILIWHDISSWHIMLPSGIIFLPLIIIFSIFLKLCSNDDKLSSLIYLKLSSLWLHFWRIFSTNLEFYMDKFLSTSWKFLIVVFNVPSFLLTNSSLNIAY